MIVDWKTKQDYIVLYYNMQAHIDNPQIAWICFVVCFFFVGPSGGISSWNLPEGLVHLFKLYGVVEFIMLNCCEVSETFSNMSTQVNTSELKHICLCSSFWVFVRPFACAGSKLTEQCASTGQLLFSHFSYNRGHAWYLAHLFSNGGYIMIDLLRLQNPWCCFRAVSGALEAIKKVDGSMAQKWDLEDQDIPGSNPKSWVNSSGEWNSPLINCCITMGNHHVLMRKSTISMAIFHSKLLVYQRVFTFTQIHWNIEWIQLSWIFWANLPIW